jgi:Xaa-Pro aminopeptidase
MLTRLHKVRQLLKEQELDCAYITSPENRMYFSGFTGSNGHLLITQEDALLITDSRYTEQAKQQAPDYRIITHGLNAMPTLNEAITSLAVRNIGYESTQITDATARRLKEDNSSIEWVPMEDYGLQFRAIKDAEELSHIRKAVQIADSAIMKLAKWMVPGMTEREIQIELEYLMAKEGSEGPAFGTIVASGKRSSLPHGTATDKTIQPGEMVVIDFGTTYRGYKSDLTRTLWVGVPEPEILYVFHVVLKAQEAALAAIKPGMTCGDVDKVHRDIFREEGLETYSLRGLGHGVGLHIHELPRVVMDSEHKLEPGMIFTVEPGLYLPEVGGVRIEDIVRVTEKGCEVLTKCPKNLQVH